MCETTELLYPTFSARFMHGAITIAPEPNTSSEQQQEAAMEASGGPGLTRPNLRTLDLRGLQRDDGPPSETQQRREKYQYFDKHCSEVSAGLFLSGDTVARSRETLAQHRVTQVVNCVGFVCKDYFKDELQYRTYFLQGS